jgi:hypothetical protein
MLWHEENTQFGKVGYAYSHTFSCLRKICIATIWKKDKKILQERGLKLVSTYKLEHSEMR